MKAKKQVIEYRNNFITAQQTFKYTILKTPHRYIYNILFNSEEDSNITRLGGCLITKF